MRSKPRWLVWRWELGTRGKWTKVPYQPAHPDRKASSTDPSTWGSYELATEVFSAARADGIGFALADGEIAAFDIDDCRDPQTGIIAPWAWDLIEGAQSYAEVTVSGTGVRILGLAVGDHVHRKQAVPQGGSLETYRRAARYIVVTSDMLAGYDALLNIDGLIDSTVTRLDEEKRQAKETARKAEAFRPKPGETDISRFFDQPAMPRRDGLPDELDRLIRFGVPEGQRSDKFFHVVGWLKDRGRSPGEIEALLGAHPEGIAAKYAGRLRAQIDVVYDKAETKARGASGSSSRPEAAPSSEFDGSSGHTPNDPPFELKWHGDPDDSPLKEWLIDKTLPKVGTALLSGQWGTYKTFVGFELSGCVMTQAAFAGRKVMRQGGVLWIAVEGQDEVRVRLVGLVNEKIKPTIGDESAIDAERLPFVWVETCPKLSDPNALPKLRALVRAAADGLRERFDMPLAMVLIDTLSPAAEFKDANDTAENQRVFNVLSAIAREFETLLIAVDHMGKDVSTGTRNSSVKEADVHTVLALLADRDLAGTVINPRMAIRKVRGAPTGQEIKFDKRVVPVDEWGNTTLVIDWAKTEIDFNAAPSQKPEKPVWTGKAKFLKDALERAMIDKGVKRRPFGMEGHEVKTISRESARAEFYKLYSADNAGTKRKAFNRLMEDAAVKGLIASIEIADSDWLWFCKNGTEGET